MGMHLPPKKRATLLPCSMEQVTGTSTVAFSEASPNLPSPTPWTAALHQWCPGGLEQDEVTPGQV